MALKDLFTMVKSDRYTQDGRDQLIKAQEVETEDRKYNNGEISEKTGLMKTPKGWVEPPKGKQIKKPDGKSGSAEKHAKAMENAKKVGIVSKVPEGWKKAEGVTTAPNGYVAITNGGSHFPKEGQQKKEIKFIKEEDFNKSNTQSAKFDEYGLPSNETIAMKDKFLKEENVADPSKLTNKEFNALAEKLDKKLGINNKERAQELLVAETEETESKSASKPKMTPEQKSKWEAKAANPSETKSSLRNFISSMSKPEAKANPHADEIVEIYKKELAKRENNPGYRPEKVYSDTSNDTAPRVLTGDTRIRIRK